MYTLNHTRLCDVLFVFFFIFTAFMSTVCDLVKQSKKDSFVTNVNVVRMCYYVRSSAIGDIEQLDLSIRSFPRLRIKYSAG